MSAELWSKNTPTRREHQLIGLISRGMQNKNIAYELKISENTVRTHISNIMRKYQLKNRTQIAIFFTKMSSDQAGQKIDLANRKLSENQAPRYNAIDR